VPPYFGAGGWLALDLAAPGVDWAEVDELLDSSYRQVALVRMLKVLDAAEPDVAPHEPAGATRPRGGGRTSAGTSEATGTRAPAGARAHR
jgi:hypothetical protein